MHTFFAVYIINNLKARGTGTDTHMHTLQTRSISRNQVCVSLPVRVPGLKSKKQGILLMIRLARWVIKGEIKKEFQLTCWGSIKSGILAACMRMIMHTKFYLHMHNFQLTTKWKNTKINCTLYYSR